VGARARGKNQPECAKSAGNKNTTPRQIAAARRAHVPGWTGLLLLLRRQSDGEAAATGYGARAVSKGEK
jgi:hypothetical protein